LPDPQVLSLSVAGDVAYVGTPMGVVEFRGGRRLRTLADGLFARALALRGETLHVGTEDEGVIEVPLGPRSRPVRADEDAPCQAPSRYSPAGSAAPANGRAAPPLALAPAFFSRPLRQPPFRGPASCCPSSPVL
jgi:hypothetical protein